MDQPPPYAASCEPQKTAFVNTAAPPQAPPPVVHVHQITVSLGPEPQLITCPSCRSSIVTELRHETSSKTHLMALLLCLVFWPLTCIPYCIDSCQNANHYCPRCGSFIGSYR